MTIYELIISIGDMTILEFIGYLFMSTPIIIGIFFTLYFSIVLIFAFIYIVLTYIDRILKTNLASIIDYISNKFGF